LGVEPEPTYDNPAAYVGQRHPEQPHALSLADIEPGQVVVRFSPHFGPKNHVVVYIYQDDIGIRCDFVGGFGYAADMGLVGLGNAPDGPRNPNNYTVALADRHTLPQVIANA
jgi:hypothetical protein